MWTFGGGRNKEFGPFGERDFKQGHVYTNSLKKSSYNGKTLKKIERIFARLLDYKRSNLYFRLRRKEISDIFLNKRSKIALNKTILRDLVPNCGPLSGVGVGTNPLISPQPTPMHGFFPENTHFVYAVTETCAPLWSIVKISMRHFGTHATWRIWRTNTLHS